MNVSGNFREEESTLINYLNSDLVPKLAQIGSEDEKQQIISITGLALKLLDSNYVNNYEGNVESIKTQVAEILVKVPSESLVSIIDEKVMDILMSLPNKGAENSEGAQFKYNFSCKLANSKKRNLALKLLGSLSNEDTNKKKVLLLERDKFLKASEPGNDEAAINFVNTFDKKDLQLSLLANYFKTNNKIKEAEDVLSKIENKDLRDTQSLGYSKRMGLRLADSKGKEVTLSNPEMSSFVQREQTRKLTTHRQLFHK